MSIRFTLQSPLTDHVLELFKDEEKAARFKAGDYNFYLGRIWLVLNRLNALDDEIRHTLRELETPAFPVHASLLLKMYTITIDTMSDVFAWLISEIFDLGYDTKQISLGTVLKNRHVLASEVGNIFKDHSATLRTVQFGKQRNDIVHRGILDEPQLAEFDWQITKLVAENMEKKLPLGTGADSIGLRLRQFCEEKQTEFSSHYDSVLHVLDLVMARLSEEVRKRK